MLPLCFRLIFIYDKDTQKFVADVLDPSLLDVKLVEKGAQLMGTDWIAPEVSLRSLTFRDLHGRSLEFDRKSIHRPYKRALNFQARQARKAAILKRGWRQASWDFEDFFTEGMPVLEKLAL